MSVLDKKEEKKEMKIKDALSTLENAGLSYVEISFDGAGDSGEIHNATFGTITFRETAEYSWQHREITPKPSASLTIHRDVHQCLEEHVYAALDQADVDWYNNSGGFGCYVFYRKNERWKYDFQINTRYTEYTCELDQAGIDIDFEEGGV